MDASDRSEGSSQPEMGFPKMRLPKPEDILTGELAKPGLWVVANIETNETWPLRSQKVSFKGASVWIIPHMEGGWYPALAVSLVPGQQPEEGQKLLMQFLTILSWVQRAGYMVVLFGGGGLPRPFGRSTQSFYSTCDEFNLDYFPEPVDDKALLALALVREGRSLNHSGYAFLSFYRTVEVAFPDGRQRGAWISASIAAMADTRAKDVISRLQNDGVSDIGAHLYKSNRMAIAHASHDPIIDPDNPEHARRLYTELPLMAALAELAIEQSFNVNTLATEYREHLYELSGFRKIFDPKFVDDLINERELPPRIDIDLPLLSIGLAGKEQFNALSNLELLELAFDEAKLALILGTIEGFIRIALWLDFKNERVEIEPLEDLACRDDGSPGAAEAQAELVQFRYDLLSNGRLRISNALTGEIISRKSAYIPVNVMVDHKAARADIAQWKDLARKRRAEADAK